MKLLLAALAAVCVCLTGCDKRPVVENEKFVSLHYKGTLADGTEFDASKDRGPLEFIYGMGQMIPGFEKGIAGMRAGDKKTITIKAIDAYGLYDDRLAAAVPKENLPEGFTPEVGMQLAIPTEQGTMPVRVKEITDTEIILDYNHPLAGEDLTFEVEIVELRDASAEELAPLKAIIEKPVPGL